jgi:RNA polymerase sigma-70 factor, ECF subfamily
MKSFEEAITPQYGYLIRVLRRLGVASDDVEDVAQDVMIASYMKWAEFDHERPLRPWLVAFAAHIARNHRRKIRPQALDEVRARTEDNPEDRDQVLRALASLPFEQRICIVLHDIEGWSAPEVAQGEEIPLNTVYSRIRLGRIALRNALQNTEEASNV